jgi:RNA polymerase sigma-70 factor (ECF subfamily)
MTRDPHPLLQPAAERPGAPAMAGDVTAGGVDGFERLYREHVGRVFALCLRMTGDRRDAEELTQDVFVRAWEKLPTFRGESALGTWLHRIAVNAALERLRSDRRRTARVEPGEDAVRLAAARASSPDERLDLETAIAALPPGARTVFVLHDVEGYRHEEIAALTGAAVGTMRAQLHRARKLLMEALGR